MEIYSYKAKDAKGAVFEDAIQAVSKESAAAAIRSRGLQILTIKKREGVGKGLFAGKISTSEKASFCRFMATMLRSGMSVPEAVDIIKEETKNKRFKRILSDLSFQTQKGKSLSIVFSHYSHDFNEIFLTMIKAGEESGTLEKSFDYLAVQLTASHDLTQKITGSMMYPAVIVVAMVGNGLLMMLFVLPRISGAFLKMEVNLPVYTVIMMKLGNFMGAHTIAILVGTVLVMALTGLTFFWGRTRAVIVRFLAKMPIVRNIVKNIDIARFSRTLSTLLKSGVPIIESLDVAADTLTQKAFKREAEGFSQSVAKGESLSDVLMKNREIFPSVMIQTIRAGEKAGTLEDVLKEMADFYEREIEYALKRFTALLEPILMLVIGVVVGVMVIMMIAPIYSIIGGLQETIQQ